MKRSEEKDKTYVLKENLWTSHSFVVERERKIQKTNEVEKMRKEKKKEEK